MLKFSSFIESVKKAAQRLLPFVRKKTLASGEDGIAWLSQELGLDTETIKKGLMRPGQNDPTVDPSDVISALSKKAEGIIKLENKMLLTSAITSPVALGVPWALATLVAPSYGFLGILALSPLPLTSAVITDNIGERQKKLLEDYGVETNRLRNLFTAKAAQHDRIHGPDSFSIDAALEKNAVLTVAERPITQLYEPLPILPHEKAAIAAFRWAFQIKNP